MNVNKSCDLDPTKKEKQTRENGLPPVKNSNVFIMCSNQSTPLNVNLIFLKIFYLLFSFGLESTRFSPERIQSSDIECKEE